MEKGLRKRKFKTNLGNHIQPIVRDLVRSRRLALLTLYFELCMKNVAISTCLIVVSSSEYHDDTFFHGIHSSTSLVLDIYFHISRNWNSLPKLEILKPYLLISQKLFKFLLLLFLSGELSDEDVFKCSEGLGPIKKMKVERMMFKKEKVDI